MVAARQLLLLLALGEAQGNHHDVNPLAGAWWPPRAPPGLPPFIPPPLVPPLAPPVPPALPPPPAPPPPPFCNQICGRYLNGVVYDVGCVKYEAGVGVCQPRHWGQSCPGDYPLICYRDYAYWSSTVPPQPKPPPSPSPPTSPMVPPGSVAPPPRGCFDTNTKCLRKAQKGKCWKKKVADKCTCACPAGHGIAALGVTG